MTYKIDNYGNKIWLNAKGNLHRLNDLPAIEYAKGSKSWYENGKLHRLNDLPAIEAATGSKFWYVNGEIHRLGGLPAIEYANGDKEWHTNDKRHRLGSLPAMEYANGNKAWYIYDISYSYEQVCNFYEILTRFGRYCLKKIRLRQLKKVKFTQIELLCMPSKGRYPGGHDSHKVTNYFMNYVKN